MSIFKLLIFLVACGFPALFAAETWQPHQHPATLNRQFHAFTQPNNHMSLASEVGGIITFISLDRGDTITEPGETTPLITLDTTVAHIKVQQAQLAITVSNANITTLNNQLQQAQRRAEYEAAEAKRLKPLVGKQFPKRDYDRAQWLADDAAINVQTITSQIATAQAQLKELEQHLALAKDHLKRHHISGPIGWQVVARHSQPGSVIQPGTPILELVDTSSLRAEFRLSSSELSTLQTLPVINLEAPASNQAFSATIKRIDPRFDPVSRKHLVELTIAKPESLLGSTEVTLNLTMPDPNGLVVIPLEFTYKDFQRLRVMDASGTWYPVTPLRQVEQHLLINPDSLPADIILHKPPVEPES